MAGTVPFGRWPSPVSAALLTAPDLRTAEVRVDRGTCWWSESRPAEGGRTQLVRLVDACAHDDLPEGYGARSLVHEYGGGAWTVQDGTVVFTNLADQRVYRLDEGSDTPVPITPEQPTARAWRFGALEVLPAQPPSAVPWVVAVREDHTPDVVERHGEAVNEVVALPLDGAAAADPSLVRVLVSGPDFVASPRAADRRLAWVQWSHPNMPFDDTSLWVAELVDDGHGLRVARPVLVAGGSDEEAESVMSPAWGPGGDLWFISDRSGWWNLYRWDGAETVSVAPVAAEVGNGPGPLGSRDLDFLPDGRVVTTLTSGGRSVPAVVDPARPDQPPQPLDCPLTAVRQAAALPDGRVLVVAGGPSLAFTTALVDLDGRVQPLRAGVGAELPDSWWSHGEPMAYRSADGRTAHAVLYRPRNPDVPAPAGSLPPLVVMLHGGPTGRTDTSLRLAVQYWTTRGFAVADLDYTGSTGYGRAYRRALNGRWGVRDVEDCLAVVRHLADAGLVDRQRAVIRGGSAGGFTVLAALCHPETTFAAGASYFGVADLLALARETHKFESRYLDSLIGPLPEAEAEYRERSPISHVAELSVPVALFQGADDPVVPPEQSRMIARALADRGIPHEYVEFPGEGHGFRAATAIVTAAETELAFYRRVLRL